MPLTYTGSPDVLADLKKIFRTSTPADIGQVTEVQPMGEALLLAEGTIAHYARESRWGTADGKYLELHARGEGLYKQAGETDDALRARMRTPPLAVTKDDILSAMQQIVNTNGGGTVYLEELPRQALYLNRQQCLNRGWLMGSRYRQIVIVYIPHAANCLAACQDTLRAKVLAAKEYIVREYA